MSTNNKKKKSVTMDPNGQTRYTSKKTRNSNNSPHAGPKYSKTGSSSSSGSASVGYDPVSKSTTQSSSSHSTPKATVLRFDQPLKRKRKNNANDAGKPTSAMSINSVSSTSTLKRKRKNNANDAGKPTSAMSINSVSSTSTASATSSGTTAAVRPTFQFKIGMQVGVALGDCFLQLQKLENSMEKLRNVSEDITDVMQCIEQMGGAEEIKQRAKRKKSASKENEQHGVDEIEDPIEEVHVLNDNLCKWQKDASKRMKNVSVTVSKLQSKLEDLDDYHSQAQQAVLQHHKHDQTEIDKAMATIKQLQAEVNKTKMELTQKTMMMQQLKKSSSEPSGQDLIREKLEKLESKEKELDRDAEIIATQSEELRKESERLLTERDEVRKQKEQWQKMIDEVKEQKAKLEKRESELQANHKKLLELHETLSEEKKKLHKKARKIKAREKRLNAIRAAQSQYVQQQTNYQVPSSNGSDYAESELTYFSDGDTEIASVNSISDDESQDNNYHKQQLKAIAHLGVPQNPLF
eukprot:CAMPEP_0197076740 /NCGR_PEP_ID=MMETSP1384-20130603/212263_1 /TAXON_ID=29189 /ORGANISM="Ammonia sp." /LENGTH=520 /DNA_ID=CAMNT_0042515599 /DNA_START=64 /DNA_END=1626 /DNA_ORIENTATION=+